MMIKGYKVFAEYNSKYYRIYIHLTLESQLTKNISDMDRFNKYLNIQDMYRNLPPYREHHYSIVNDDNLPSKLIMIEILPSFSDTLPPETPPSQSLVESLIHVAEECSSE